MVLRIVFVCSKWDLQGSRCSCRTSRRPTGTTGASSSRAQINSHPFSALVSGTELRARLAVYRRRHSSYSRTTTFARRSWPHSTSVVLFLVIFSGRCEVGFGASIQERADDSVHRYIRSNPGFPHLRESAITSSLYAVVSGPCGWTDDLILGVNFIARPNAKSLQRVLTAALWQILVPYPSELFMCERTSWCTTCSSCSLHCAFNMRVAVFVGRRS